MIPTFVVRRTLLSRLFPFVGLFLALAGCGGGAGTSGNIGSGATGGTPVLLLSASRSSYTVYVGTQFIVPVSVSLTGSTVTPSLTVGSLPSGMTTVGTLPVSVPATGDARIELQVANNMAPGSYTFSIMGNAGSATAQVSIPVTVTSGTPTPAGFTMPSSNEVALTPGTSTSLNLQVLGDSLFAITPAATGLPAGVTASFDKQLVQAGDTLTVTLTAAANAPVAQNAEWSLTGTTGGNGTVNARNLLLNVTPADSAAGWTNQTDFLSTRATPFSAVYDPLHHLIFSSNNTWNRIDVIATSSHSIVKKIPIRDPRGIDLSIDGTTLWVCTGSQVVYGVDTNSLHVRRYALPRLNASATFVGHSWEGNQIFSLADGTVLLEIQEATGSGIEFVAVWDPAANSLISILPPTGAGAWGYVARSGDGKHVFSVEGANAFSYDVASKTLSTLVKFPGYALRAYPSPDGSTIAIVDEYSGFNLYDSNFNLLSTLPGDGGALSNAPYGQPFGGIVFSGDGKTIFEETGATPVASIITIDAASGAAETIAPAMPVLPPFIELSPIPYYIPIPFGVDSNGQVLGIQYLGISFDDSTAVTNFVTGQPGSPTNMNHMNVYSGPATGGTTSSGFGDTFSLTPDVYYGSIKGTASLVQNFVQITSPPSTKSGPVNLKMLFADGTEVFDPLFFTYGTYPLDAVVSGGPPQGGASGTLNAFGLPIDPTQDTVSIGANKAAITSTQTQYPPLIGEQTATSLSYTIPAGVPGWADITVATANGTGTLPKSFFYAKSVTDYPMTDSPTYVFFDGSRNNVYLSAGDHIDVFSLGSNTFLAPLQPPAVGTTKQFQGLALTPDKKTLLAADLADSSLAVIDPDAPSNSYAVGGMHYSLNQCQAGPLFVTADNQGNALVADGAVIGPSSCGPGGSVYITNLTTRTVTTPQDCRAGSGYLSATADGSMIVLGWGGDFQLYNSTLQQCIPTVSSAENGGTASADGKVFASFQAFFDPAGNVIGKPAVPPALYSGSPLYLNKSLFDTNTRQNPQLNAAGSLYYWAHPNYVDIVDVQHGLSRLRFSLPETITNTVSPIAIDSSGQRIFLITNKGLTVVDLGEAPLSIGHLSQDAATPGTQIVVRGSGFENGISASIGGQAATVSFTDSETLTLTIPPVSSGIQDIVLNNPDGTTYTLENGLTVQ